jgi:hypothetical protein
MSEIKSHNLRIAAYDLFGQLMAAKAYSEDEDVNAFFDQLVSNDQFVDELEYAFQRNTNLRLVDRYDLERS